MPFIALPISRSIKTHHTRPLAAQVCIAVWGGEGDGGVLCKKIYKGKVNCNKKIPLIIILL